MISRGSFRPGATYPLGMSRRRREGMPYAELYGEKGELVSSRFSASPSRGPTQSTRSPTGPDPDPDNPIRADGQPVEYEALERTLEPAEARS